MCVEKERGELDVTSVFGGLTVACVWSGGGEKLWSAYLEDWLVYMPGERKGPKLRPLCYISLTRAYATLEEKTSHVAQVEKCKFIKHIVTAVGSKYDDN